jgi:cytochrome P450
VEPSTTYMGRTVAADTDLGGVEMKKGDKVMLLFAAANFDEPTFDRPDEFLIERGNNRHVAFGAGAHRCQGAALGRLEMRVAFEEILDAIPDYVVDLDGVVRRDAAAVHSLKHMAVTFTPRPSSSST